MSKLAYNCGVCHTRFYLKPDQHPAHIFNEGFGATVFCDPCYRGHIGKERQKHMDKQKSSFLGDDPQERQHNIDCIKHGISILQKILDGQQPIYRDNGHRILELNVEDFSNLCIRSLCDKYRMDTKAQRKLVKKPIPRSYFEPGTKITFNFDGPAEERVIELIIKSDSTGFGIRTTWHQYTEVVKAHYDGVRLWCADTEQWIKPYVEVWETPATT